MITRTHAAQLDTRLAAPSRRATSAGRMQTYNSHPATGLSVEMLLSYYRQAERGVPVRQFDCFDDLIEVDGHLRGLITNRIESISGADWSIKPGGSDRQSIAAAIDLEDRLHDLPSIPGEDSSSEQSAFRDFMEHQLTAPYYGLAATRLEWDYTEGAFAPGKFDNHAHRRFASPSQDQANQILLLEGDTAADLVRLEAGQWAVSRYRNRNPWAAGLMRTAGFWAMTKRWGVRDWQVFGELFGIPLVVGFYEEGASLASRLALNDAIKLIGTDGWASLADTTNITIKDTARAGDSSTVYPRQIALAEAQMSKLIAGSTTASDTGGDVGSYSLGVVHESRAYSLAKSDARRVEEMFARDIGAWFCRYNGYDRARPPRLKIQIARDSLERAKVLQIVGQAMDLDESQMREEFSLAKPVGPGVRFQQTAVPSP